ncbi:MAG: heme ABC exporter ATP-binding protein CcmA [Alphaproteobacteria bacterium]|nr:heme ABC exporter ATP-binding protein CcmA [Alphaproteobacteria bacterium]
MTARAIAAGLTVAYRGRTVLADVDLEVRSGEVLGLMGPNGGGKSTLLLALAGLIRPTAGTVSLDGVPAHRAALEATGKVGLITTVPGLYPLLTGWENLAFFGALYGLDEATVRTRVAPFLDELGLTARMDLPVGTGSSGMQQKISLARALLMDPPLLLLDEPTANLDPVSADVIFRTAREHADRGRAVVWVTHDLHAAERICDRIALVAGGIRAIHVLEGERTVTRPRLLDTWRAHLQDEA